MALDPSVILQGQAPQIQNPLTAATQAATMANLMQEHQANAIKLDEANREQLERNTVRDAYKNNTQADNDGNPILNRQGVVKDLYKAGLPQVAQQTQLSFQKADLDRIVQQHEIGSQIAMNINPNDEGSYLRAQAQAKQFGLPDLADQLPKFSDPNFPSALSKFQIQMLDTKDRLAQQNKQTEFELTKQKNDIEQRRLDTEMAKYHNDKEMKAMEDFNSGVSGSRQQLDAVQMEKDHLSAKKIDEIKNQAPGGDLNKLNPQQMKMIMAEGVKMVTGGAPTVSELEEMTPNGMAQKFAKTWQGITNKSQPANAGEFVQQVIDYSGGIDSIAKKGLTQRSNEMLERVGPYMNPKIRATIKNQMEHEFDDTAAPNKSANASTKNDTQSYADKHGIDPGLAEFVKKTRSSQASNRGQGGGG